MTEFTIDCGEILLREYRMEDVDAICALTQESAILEFLPDWNVSKELRLNWMANYELVENKQFLQAVANGGQIGELRLRLGIVLKETGAFIGWCTTGIKDELPSPNREIAYAISEEYSGRGYTTLAARALIAYLFENTDVKELNAVALLNNISSNKVIQKCGFNQLGEMDIDGQSHFYYKLRKSEWSGTGK